MGSRKRGTKEAKRGTGAADITIASKTGGGGKKAVKGGGGGKGSVLLPSGSLSSTQPSEAFQKKMKAISKHKSQIKTNKLKVAGAGIRLAGRLMNPKNQVKMLSNAAKGKGLVLPGSNYIGPGNPMDRKVKSKGDALAKTHDEEYDRLIKAGYSKPKIYGGYSYSDAKLKKSSNIHTPEGLATYMGMKGKQLIHKTGLSGKKITKKDLLRKEAKQRNKENRKKQKKQQK